MVGALLVPDTCASPISPPPRPPRHPRPSRLKGGVASNPAPTPEKTHAHLHHPRAPRPGGRSRRPRRGPRLRQTRLRVGGGAVRADLARRAPVVVAAARLCGGRRRLPARAADARL